ncbi:hypothetical protein IMZ48_25660 [Candidatus Bathyarchaeota archaeon]|nr:hypothetical protein [Candidatus Bathyarchaeota archaeon]
MLEYIANPPTPRGGGFHKVCKDCKIVSQDDLHNKDKTITSLECDCKQHDGTTRKSKTNMSECQPPSR